MLPDRITASALISYDIGKKKEKINHAGGYFKKINAVIDGKIHTNSS
jgi:hypothetical protein